MSEATVMDVDVELQEVRERPPETLGLVVSDADKDLTDDVEASVDEKTWSVLPSSFERVKIASVFIVSIVAILVDVSTRSVVVAILLDCLSRNVSPLGLPFYSCMP